MKTKILSLVLGCLFLAFSASAQSTAFTFQGSLQNGGAPANGNYDFEFIVFDALTGGSAQATPLTLTGVGVANGQFTVTLDFGAVFTGAPRYLETRVRVAGGGSYTPLAPRQFFASAPYATRALVAADAQTVGGLNPSQFVLTGDSRLSDARLPLAGSTNYVQNRTSQQSSTNFNVSGTGTANTFNSLNGYNLGGQPFLTSLGSNTSIGVGAGAANFGLGNAFFGNLAGQSATSNSLNNSFFGYKSGSLNANGAQNSFFGTESGAATTSASGNSFFGYRSGFTSDGGGLNSFFGSLSGTANTVGSRNVFVGSTAGRDNQTGSDNVFVGGSAGQINIGGGDNVFIGGSNGSGNLTGSFNTFVGRSTGISNVSGSSNTLLGAGANVATGALTNATALGAGAIVSTSNTVVLGRQTDTVQVPGTLSADGSGLTNLNAASITAGVIDPARLGGGFIANNNVAQTGNFNITGTGTANILSASQFNSGGSRILKTGSFNVFLGAGAGTNTTADGGNTFVGAPSGTANTTGSFNSFFGSGTGELNVTGGGNAFFGYRAGQISTGSGNALFGALAGSSVSLSTNSSLFGNGASMSEGLTNATAIGWRAFVGSSNSLVLGSTNGANGATADTNVGIGTTAPTARLSVFGGGFGANLLVADSNTTGTTFDLRNSSTGGRTWRWQSMGSGDLNRIGNLELWNVGGNIALGITPAGNVGVGTISPFTKFQVNGNGLFQGDLAANNFNGNGSGIFVGPLGVGTVNPQQQLHIVGNGIFTGNLNIGGTVNQFSNAGNANFFMKAQGAANGINFGVAANAGSNSTLYLSQYDGTSYQDRMIVNADGNVQIPNKLLVGLDASPDKLAVNGIISFATLGAAGSTQLCRNFANQISTCSSSLRYKSNVSAFADGLSFIRRLRPIAFDWKDGGMKDVGYGAEDIAKIDPRFVTFNEKGEVEGVKYDRVGVVLVNAVMEQQSEIERQRETIKKQQAEIEALKSAVCALAPGAAVCTAPPVK